MKIAILGTRGIPNHYGGFEQYAELFAVYLVQHGWDVTVYNSSAHPYQEAYFKGVRIRKAFDPEGFIGTAGQFIYDFNCIMDIRRECYDMVYQLGYTSSAIFNFLLPGESLIVTNMDGLEWKRTKYHHQVQRFLKYSEAIVVRKSHYLIADSIPIRDYIRTQYRKEAFFAAYTAAVPEAFPPQLPEQYGLKKEGYFLVIARMEPENNIEMILRGYEAAKDHRPLLLIGSLNTKFGQYLKKRYTSPGISFRGALYEKETLNALRKYAALYFHGHSVGGTNPSLLEAMACGGNIVAHDNPFNRSVLGTEALFFQDSGNITAIINKADTFCGFFAGAAAANIRVIQTRYSEEMVFGTLAQKMKGWIREHFAGTTARKGKNRSSA